MKYKVFVDGQEGTTGLEINERLKKRHDIEIIKIDPNKRRDIEERRKLINSADIVFLCLPDDAAREAVSLLDNPSTRIIDGSTAHRTADGWAYGIPELSKQHRDKIFNAKRVSVPGCFATGFNMLMYPLVKEGIVPEDYPVSCHAISGYSGGGKKLIETYDTTDEKSELRYPSFYALGLQHKHLPEMRKHSGLTSPPVFTPIVADYYRGMTVAVPFHCGAFKQKLTAAELHEFFADYYQNQVFVRVLRFGIQNDFKRGFLSAGTESCNGTNNIEIMIFGHEEQTVVAARFDNLGKGASGAAVQNMNIMLGVDESCGL